MIDSGAMTDIYRRHQKTFTTPPTEIHWFLLSASPYCFWNLNSLSVPVCQAIYPYRLVVDPLSRTSNLALCAKFILKRTKCAFLFLTQVTYPNEQGSIATTLYFIFYGDLVAEKSSSLNELMIDSMDRPFVSGNLKYVYTSASNATVAKIKKE